MDHLREILSAIQPWFMAPETLSVLPCTLLALTVRLTVALTKESTELDHGRK